MQETWVRSLGVKIPWSRSWQPPPVFLPGISHRLRTLAGYCLWGSQRIQDWMTEHATTLLVFGSTAGAFTAKTLYSVGVSIIFIKNKLRASFKRWSYNHIWTKRGSHKLVMRKDSFLDFQVLALKDNQAPFQNQRAYNSDSKRYGRL